MAASSPELQYAMQMVQPYIQQAVYDGEAKAGLLESYASQVSASDPQRAQLLQLLAQNVRSQGHANAAYMTQMVADIPRQRALAAQAEQEKSQQSGYNSYINAYYGALGRNAASGSSGGDAIKF